MKNLVSTLALCTIILFAITSCGDDKEACEFGIAQNPILQFTNDLVLTRVDPDIGNYLIGSMLEFQKEGKITRLCLKAPNDGNYDLTLWDLSDSTVLTSIAVSADSGEIVYGDITDVPVLAGSRVAVTMSSANLGLYEYRNGVGTVTPIYPATYEDVTILGYGSISGPIGLQFPEDFFDFYYTGIADLIFKPKLGCSI